MLRLLISHLVRWTQLTDPPISESAGGVPNYGSGRTVAECCSPSELRCAGDPGRARTCNLQLRRLELYPVELRGRSRQTGLVAPRNAPIETEVVGIALRPDLAFLRLLERVWNAMPLRIGDRFLLAREGERYLSTGIRRARPAHQRFDLARARAGEFQYPIASIREPRLHRALRRPFD